MNWILSNFRQKRQKILTRQDSSAQFLPNFVFNCDDDEDHVDGDDGDDGDDGNDGNVDDGDDGDDSDDGDDGDDSDDGDDGDEDNVDDYYNRWAMAEGVASTSGRQIIREGHRWINIYQIGKVFDI